MLPLDYLERAGEFSRTHNLKLHLDGARIFNGAVKQQVDVKNISRHFDSVSVCLSKGLGAPVGSVLCGPADFIDRARRWRKVAGGGMRQAGILAAAGLYALEHHVARLADDHNNAEQLAAALGTIDQLQVSYSESQTNMVFVTLPAEHAAPLAAYLKDKSILTTPDEHLRLVTHLDISARDIEKAAAAFSNYFAGVKNG